jgi:hypothetical protein
MASLRSMNVKNLIISIGTKIPESLQVSQNQSQTKEVDFLRSLEVSIVIICIGTKISDSLRVSNKKSHANEIDSL